MLAAGCAALLLLRATRDARTTMGRLSATRELRHARQLLLTDLSALEGRDLLQWQDSLIEFRGHLGLLVTCVVRATEIEVAVAPDEPDATWIRGVRSGDELVTWRSGMLVSDSLAPEPRVTTGGATALGAGRCPPAWTTDPTRRWRIPVSAGAPTTAAGSPTVLRRRVQLLHYRSNGQWWLGRRTRDGTTWEGLQPVAGPLQSPAERGVRLRALSGQGGITAVPESIAVLQFLLRAAAVRRGLTAVPESAELNVALRASLWTRGRP
jgi:hypothetical protein